jgi:uncharacterized membrane protein YcaP (DUF421 family)
MAIFAVWYTDMWHAMFALGPSVAEKMLRPVVVYVFLVILLRIFGKRELAQLNPFDLVVLLSLSNTVQNAIIGDDNSVTGGLVGAFALCAINYVVVRFLFKHRRLDQLIEGSPTVLVENGQLVRRGMAEELLTEADLVTIAHRQGFASIDEIERCVLEPGGTFFIQGKKPHGPARRQIEILSRIDQLQSQMERQYEEMKALVRER